MGAGGEQEGKGKPGPDSRQRAGRAGLRGPRRLGPQTGGAGARSLCSLHAGVPRGHPACRVSVEWDPGRRRLAGWGRGRGTERVPRPEPRQPQHQACPSLPCHCHPCPPRPAVLHPPAWNRCTVPSPPRLLPGAREGPAQCPGRGGPGSRAAPRAAGTEPTPMPHGPASARPGVLVLGEEEEVPQSSKLLNVLFAIKTPCNCVNTWEFSPLPKVLSAFLGFFGGGEGSPLWGEHSPAPCRGSAGSWGLRLPAGGPGGSGPWRRRVGDRSPPPATPPGSGAVCPARRVGEHRPAPWGGLPAEQQGRGQSLGVLFINYFPRRFYF